METAMTTHTPGPWHTSADNTQVNGGPHDTFLARIHWGSFTEHQADANARLISAAPELLEALQEMIWYQTAVLNEGPTGKDIRLRAEAVIRKAKGRD